MDGGEEWEYSEEWEIEDSEKTNKKLSSKQIDDFKQWITNYVQTGIESTDYENEEDKQGIKEMYKSDEVDLLDILNSIKNNDQKAGYELWSSMDTAIRNSVPDYIQN